MPPKKRARKVSVERSESKNENKNDINSNNNDMNDNKNNDNQKLKEEVVKRNEKEEKVEKQENYEKEEKVEEEICSICMETPEDQGILECVSFLLFGFAEISTVVFAVIFMMF